MTGTQKAIIPGILLSSLLLVFLNKLVNPPLTAIASTEESKSVEATKQKKKSNGNCQFLSRYPHEVAKWCVLIEDASAKYSIDPLLVAAVMLMESGGQPEVISHSGAVGLMQVMPRDGIASTFQCINGPCFANRPAIAELKDPIFNVDYGVRMLAGLIQREGGEREALFAYGPYNVGYSYADKVLQIYSGL